MKKKSVLSFLKDLSKTGNTVLIVLANLKGSTGKNLKVSSVGSCQWRDLSTTDIVDYEHLGYDICDGVHYPLMKLHILKGVKSERVVKSLISEMGAGAPLLAMAPALGPEKSGRQWVERFKGSNSLTDLKAPFQLSAMRFIDALVTAGAKYSIASTFRPPERAYLMHYSYEIAKKNFDSEHVPAMPGVDILWWHGDKAASVAGAAAMVAGYQTVSPGAALASNHTRGWAIDMNISWGSATLRIYDASKNLIEIADGSNDGQNPKLHAIGKTYGVFKLLSDKPHWSVDGR